MISMVISKINFPIYDMIIVSSVLIGIVYIYINLKQEKQNLQSIMSYFIMLFVFSFIFGKLFTLITNPNEKDFFDAGLSAYGGLVGVIISALFCEKLSPTNNKLVKYSILSLPLIYSLTKIACFLVGCCYGIPYKGILSVRYTDGLNIELFPIQALETIVFLTIFLVLHRLRNNKNIIYITIILTAMFKFILDFLRYDHVTKLITVNQIFSILLCALTIIVYIYNRIRNQNQEE